MTPDTPKDALEEAVKDYVVVTRTYTQLEAFKRGWHAHESATAAQAWRPISTAPKDGLEVLLRLDENTVVWGWYFNGEATWYYQDEKYQFPCLPTHWQPLPSPTLPDGKEGTK